MAHFPIFIELNGKRCVCVGGGKVAARKAKTLADFGAEVTVIAPRISAEIAALAKDMIIELIQRSYQGENDLAGAALAVAATNVSWINEQVSKDAKNMNIPVNVADAPELCTFFFPAIVRRGDLVAGLTSSGKCPALTARLREQLDVSWPPELENRLEELAEARQNIKINTSNAKQRARQIKLLADAALNIKK